MILSFFRDVLKRRYKLRTKTILWFAGCVLYVMSPWDLISDLLIPLGYTDDAVVVAFTTKIFFDELTHYKKNRHLQNIRS